MFRVQPTPSALSQEVQIHPAIGVKMAMDPLLAAPSAVPLEAMYPYWGLRPVSHAQGTLMDHLMGIVSIGKLPKLSLQHCHFSSELIHPYCLSRDYTL